MTLTGFCKKSQKVIKFCHHFDRSWRGSERGLILGGQTGASKSTPPRIVPGSSPLQKSVKKCQKCVKMSKNVTFWRGFGPWSSILVGMGSGIGQVSASKFDPSQDLTSNYPQKHQKSQLLAHFDQCWISSGGPYRRPDAQNIGLR